MLIECPFCGDEQEDDGASPKWRQQRLVLSMILAEMMRQDKKWGIQTHNHETWLAILTEEVGETAEAVLHSKFGGKRAGAVPEEVVQCAAVCFQWLVHCVRERNAGRMV